jgi:hypothetical protein
MTQKKPKDPGPQNATTIKAAVAAFVHGYDYAWIAERYKFSSAKAAQTAIEVRLGDMVGPQDAVAARNKSLARKEALLRPLMWDATHPWLVDELGIDTDERNETYWPALDRAIRLTDAIDRLLGSNAPTQIQVYRPDAQEFLATVAVLRQKALSEMPEEGNVFDADIVDEDESDSDVA